MKTQYDIIIIGGGLAGLTSAIMLAQSGAEVLVIEKKSYPYHKVCGEYVSNEVKDFLESLGLNLKNMGAAAMDQVRVSDTKGKNLKSKLSLGGFGISRFELDNKLYGMAKGRGADFMLNTRVTDVKFINNIFEVKTTDDTILTSRFVIGSYGKRDVLDKRLSRQFLEQKTGYMAVKYHIKSDYPINEIGLDNFDGGYCGISKIEDDKYCLCYLSERKNMIPFSSVQDMEKEILFKNPMLKEIFSNSTFMYEKPLVINEISFAAKDPIEDHIMMCGDTAGLIAPLCGNGMSMAIHGAKILSDLLIKSQLLKRENITLRDRYRVELRYEKQWKNAFVTRLFIGRNIQQLFGKPWLTNITLGLLRAAPVFNQWLIRQTHGSPI